MYFYAHFSQTFCHVKHCWTHDGSERCRQISSRQLQQESLSFGFLGLPVLLQHSLGEGQERRVQKHKCYPPTPVPLLLSIATTQTKTHHAVLKEQNKSTFHLLQHRLSLFQTPFWSELATQVRYVDLAIFNICSKIWLETISATEYIKTFLCQWN